MRRPIGQYGSWEVIRDVTHDMGTLDKRSKAVGALLGLALNEQEDMNVRSLAVQKLGELRAVEALDALKALAEGLDWTDAGRKLKRSSALAYWQIRVAQQKTAKAQEELLIRLLWGKNHPPPHADNILWWAAEELANRGASYALPEIERAIRFRNSTPIADRFVRLCSVKVQLLNSKPSRIEALQGALYKQGDPEVTQALCHWAIAELGKLGDEHSCAVLINYALTLQEAYHDSDGMPKAGLSDFIYTKAAHCYSHIMETLRKLRMSSEKIRSAGLRPDRYFCVWP